MDFGPLDVLHIAARLRTGEQTETLRKTEAVFHEQVPHWNLRGDALRWTPASSVVGALTLHGMVALLIGGPWSAVPLAGSGIRPEADLSQTALLEVTTLPMEMSGSTSAAAPTVTNSSLPAAAARAFATPPSPIAARASSAGTRAEPSRARAPQTVAEPSAFEGERSPEAVHFDGVALQGDDSALLGTGVPGSGARRGEGHGAARPGQAELGKALSARLVPASLRCADLFPYSARSDRETLAVEVAVSPKGSTRTSRIVSGHAHEAVFDAAALACARRLQFVPAQNTRGAEVEDRAVVRLRFERAS